MEHDWFFYARLGCECCRKCGIIKRADGQNKSCPGPVKVGPRGADQ